MDQQEDGIFVRAKGKNYGPFNQDQLKDLVSQGRFPYSCWVYFDSDWKSLAELRTFCECHPEYEQKPTEAPSKKDSAKEAPQKRSAPALDSGTGATVSAEPVWFVIRSKKKFGPYSAADIVSQLQGKQLEPGSFVWRPGFETWRRLSKVDEFSREAMKRLAKMKSDESDATILLKRKFTRAPYQVEVIAHDNSKAIEGKSLVIGEGGLFLATSRPNHQVGSRLRLHFREGESSAFNAVAEVVSVVRGETSDDSGYCMRFVAISEADRRKIAKYVSTYEVGSKSTKPKSGERR